MRLLLVDDDNDVRRALARGFKIRGVEVVEARNADEAIAQLGDFAITAVLSDIDMGPGGSGIDVLIAAKRERAIPVALMTGAPSDKRSTLAMMGGAVAVLAKPFDTDAAMLALFGQVRK